MPILLAEATPYDPGVGSVTVRMATAQSHARDALKDGKRWLPAITQGPRQQITLLGQDEMPGSLAIAYGELGLRFSEDLDNDTWSRYVWDGAAIQIWRGESGDDFADFTSVFKGRCGPLARGSRNAGSLTLRGNEGALDKDLLTETYAGTGDAEGALAMKGVLKPWVSGVVEGTPGILVDKTYWIWQLHGYGAVQSIDAAYEGGISLGSAVATVPTTFAALQALTLAEGEWAAAPAIGCVRLGAAPTKKVVFDCHGAKNGAAFPSKVGAIASHLMSVAGVASGDISTTSANALDTAFAHDWGFYTDAQVNIGDIVRKAVADVGGYTFPDENGIWRFGRFEASKTATDLKDDRTAVPLVRSVSQAISRSPVYRVEVGARRCWAVHNETDISPALIDALEANESAAGAAQTAANAAQSAANAAQADATSALGQITNIVSDSVLDKSEKPDIVQRYTAITNEQAGIDAQATSYSITTEKTAYDTAVSALTTYLTGLSPAYTDTTADTAIVRTTFNSKFTGVYSARQALLNKIAEVAGTRAQWASVTGSGKPEDGATKTASQTENLYRVEMQGHVTSTNSAAVVVGEANPNLGHDLARIVLDSVGLGSGDVISASAEIRNATSGDNVRLEMRFLDSSGSALSDTVESYANRTSFTRAKVEGVTIPSGAAVVCLQERRETGSGTIEARRAMINRGPLAAEYALPRRGSVSQPANLLPIEFAGNTTSTSSSPIIIGNDLGEATYKPFIADMGLQVGDVISASAEIANLTAGDKCRLELRFFDSSGAIIAPDHTGLYVDRSFLQRAMVDGVAIPTGTERLYLILRRQSGTGTISARKAMVNRGPFAADYVLPNRGADRTSDGYAAGVQDGAVVLQTDGLGALLGLQMLAQTVSDGTVVTFSPAFARRPEVEFDIASLPALASGESYSVRAESLTASGFTARVKKRTSGGTPVSLSTGLGTAVVAGEDYQVSKGDSRDARDGIYNFRVKGQLIAVRDTVPPAHTEGYITLEFWAKVSGTWQSLGQSTVLATGFVTETKTFDKTFAMTCTAAIGEAAGNEFRVTVAARYGTTSTDKITELTSVSWQADGTAVTETAVSQSVIAKVRPVNA